MLLLNPGLSADDVEVHRQPAFRSDVRTCCAQDPSEFPNYYLAPDVDGPGARWTRRVLKPLITEFGLQAVSANVTALEYFPYHSVGFAHGGLRLPSQVFGVEVLREAIRREAVIFVTRGREIWETAVPELVGRSRRGARRTW